MSASETLRRHTFGAPEDMGPPALERAAHQLMIEEANRRIATEKSVEQLNAELAKAKADVQASETARIAAEAKIGELIAENAKHREGYQAALADMNTRLLQSNEARTTADLLAAQARAEAEAARARNEEVSALVARLEARIEEISLMEHDEPVTMAAPEPVSYRVNVVGRDAAGDLRSLELIPVERN